MAAEDKQDGGICGEEAGRWGSILAALLAGFPGRKSSLEGLFGMSGNSYSLSSSASDSAR